MKSESTNTNVPGGSSPRRPPRNASACSTLSSGAVNGAAPKRSATSHARSRRPGGSQYGSAPSARSSAATSLRDAGRACDDRERRPRGPRAAFRARAATTERAPLRGAGRTASTTRGASSAERSRTTNSSRPDTAESRAVAYQSIVRDGVAGGVRPRADHVAAVTASPARQVAEGQPDEAPPPWDERKGLTLQSRHLAQPAASAHPGAGAGASSRQRSLMRASAPSRPSERISATNDAESRQAVPEHREEERVDVLRQHMVAAVEERPGAGSALERETPSNR